MASPCSTTRATESSRPRTTRPYPVGSSSSAVSRVAAASASPVWRDQRGQGGRPQQRGVPGQHHHVAVVVALVVGEAGQGHRHGVTGAPLLDLLDELDGHARAARAR